MSHFFVRGDHVFLVGRTTGSHRQLLRVAALLLLALLLAGCIRHRWLEVEPGEYTHVRGTGEASRAAARQIRGLHVDREAATATLTLKDGSELPLAFVARHPAEWPEGCPTNLFQHRMEVLDLEESGLAIGSLTFQEPILVRNCPGDPLEIVLREDGPTGGLGSACTDSCLVFGRAASFAAEAAILGRWRGAGYAYLRRPEGMSLMFWYDTPGAAHCQTQTPGEQRYHASCSVQTETGQQVEWEVTAGGTQASVTIGNTSYDAAQGRLFLITARGNDPAVIQLDRDLPAVEPDDASVIAFAETVPEIQQFAGPGSAPGDGTSASLPHSAKGYELYSWQEGEDGPWRYTLVTGTNRQKMVEELINGEDTVTDDGWVKLTVAGREALLELLARLPAGEQVFWRGAVAAPAGAETGQFRLPDESVVDTVTANCRELGLELMVVADELEAILAVPEKVPIGQPVNLTFTLLNHANYPLYVLKWYTPLEGIAGTIFHVRRNGEILPYQGILAMRGDPGPESYVLLPPGGSVMATVNLAQAYDFTEPGTYTVTFLSPRISDTTRTEAEMAETVDELGPVTIMSNTVTVTVSTGE